MKQRSRTSGIALFELLISLAIMSLIAVLLANSFGFLGRAMSASSDRAAQLETLSNRAFFRGIVEDLPIRKGSELRLRFSGDSKQLIFEAIVADGFFWPGEPVRISLNTSSSTSIVTLVGQAQDGSGIQQTRVIARSGDDLRISYFQAPTINQEGSWIDSWTDGSGLPDLIKLEWPTADHPIPPLVVRPGKRTLQSSMSLSSLLPPG